jgi:hypothetical protein
MSTGEPTPRPRGSVGTMPDDGPTEAVEDRRSTSAGAFGDSSTESGRDLDRDPRRFPAGIAEGLFEDDVVSSCRVVSCRVDTAEGRPL